MTSEITELQERVRILEDRLEELEETFMEHTHSIAARRRIHTFTPNEELSWRKKDGDKHRA